MHLKTDFIIYLLSDYYPHLGHSYLISKNPSPAFSLFQRPAALSRLNSPVCLTILPVAKLQTYFFVLCKKNVPILTRVVEHRPPSNKHNCWNGLCYSGHMTRSRKYINQSDRSLKSRIASQYSNYCISFLYSIFGIVQEWRDYKVGQNYPRWRKHYKSGNEESFNIIKLWMQTYRLIMQTFFLFLLLIISYTIRPYHFPWRDSDLF